jgi:hypothetical protein
VWCASSNNRETSARFSSLPAPAIKYQNTARHNGQPTIEPSLLRIFYAHTAPRRRACRRSVEPPSRRFAAPPHRRSAVPPCRRAAASSHRRAAVAQPPYRRPATPPRRRSAAPPRRRAAVPPRRRDAATPPPVDVARDMLMATLLSRVFRQGCHHQSPGTTHGETQASVLPGASGPSPKGRKWLISKADGATPHKGTTPWAKKKTKRVLFFGPPRKFPCLYVVLRL